MKPFTMKKYLYILSILCTLLCSTCSYDDIVPDNPCKSIPITSADYTYMSVLGGLYYDEFKEKLKQDTFVIPQKITFSANQDFDKYYWQSLQEPNYTKRAKTFEFYPTYDSPPFEMDMKLVGSRRPNSFCFPKDYGIDSVTKRIVFKAYTENPIHGSFTGYDDRFPGIKHTVTIKVDTVSVPDNTYYSILTGFPYGCSVSISSQSGGYNTTGGFNIDYKYARIKSFWLNRDGTVGSMQIGCGSPNAWFFLDSSNQKLIIKYNYIEDYKNPIIKKSEFIGIRE